jgi:Holliday junction DNA helicase RuvA
MSTFYNLPANGEKLSLLTHLWCAKTDTFSTDSPAKAERFAFRQLLKISGVGARLALSVLSGLSVSDLAQVVARQEVGRLTKVPGIGTKTAERLLLELKGKFADALPASAVPAAAAHNDILNALLALGYNDREAGRSDETACRPTSPPPTAFGRRSSCCQESESTMNPGHKQLIQIALVACC